MTKINGGSLVCDLIQFCQNLWLLLIALQRCFIAAILGCGFIVITAGWFLLVLYYNTCGRIYLANTKASEPGSGMATAAPHQQGKESGQQQILTDELVSANPSPVITSIQTQTNGTASTPADNKGSHVWLKKTGRIKRLVAKRIRRKHNLLISSARSKNKR